MGLENCQIYLDNPTATYCSEEIVSGRVEFNFSSVKKVGGIEIKFKGQANTFWAKNKINLDSDAKFQLETDFYSTSETYFYDKYYLLGGENDEAIEIPIGEYVYPFSYKLPPGLPTSYEGTQGKVRYTITATLIRPWKFNQSLKTAYTVIDHLDVNIEPSWREPATLVEEKYFCCLFCKSGPLTAIIKLPCTAYVPGQNIPITLEIDNVSNVGISEIRIKLKKIETFYAFVPEEKTLTKAVTIGAMIDENKIPKKVSKILNGSITIPSVPPSNLSNCNIIDIQYELRVVILPEVGHLGIFKNLPIVIGTIPLTNMVPINNFNTSNEIPSIVGWVPAPPDTPSIDPALMPPPSYEESQFGATTILDEDESEHTQVNKSYWAPTYPVYHFDQYKNMLDDNSETSLAPQPSNE